MSWLKVSACVLAMFAAGANVSGTLNGARVNESTYVPPSSGFCALPAELPCELGS